METKWIKLCVAVLASVYFIGCIANPEAWHFIDNANLLIHEGGHIVFLPFGEFLHVLGGSLTQVVLPALFVVYFYFIDQIYSAALTLFWVGENLLNVSVYAGDSLHMQLPLLFGDNSIHDWNWLLIYTGQLRHTDSISHIIKALGILTILIATAASIYFSLHDKKESVTIYPGN